MGFPRQRDNNRLDSRRKGAGDARKSGRETETRGSGGFREWGKTLVITVVLLVVIRTFLVQTFVIVSGSMEDTLLIGDFLVVNRLAFGTRILGTNARTPGFSHPERGDVIVFDPAHEEGTNLVKRLVGMPGDTLRMREKVLYIDGVAYDEPYVKWTDDSEDPYTAEMAWQRGYLTAEVDPTAYRPTRDNWGPLVVPDGNYFMMGDNRDASRDARSWGFIERWRMIGEAKFIYFSYDRESYTPFAIVREVRWDRIGEGIR